MKYNDKQCFIYEMKVRYSDLFRDRKVGPAQLVKFLQDLAVQHSNTIGYDTDYLAERHLAWLLLYWDIDIYRLPGDQEVLTGLTWSRKHRHIQADRDTEILDESGEPICYATARWVITDIAKRRPYKMSPEFFEPYLFPEPRPIKEPDYSFPEPGETPDSERTFLVTRRDMDSNDHVNNATYVEWALDDVGDDIWDNCKIKKIKVAYKHEFRRNDKVLTRYYIDRSNPAGPCTISLISNADDPDKICCQVAFFWEEQHRLP